MKHCAARKILSALALIGASALYPSADAAARTYIAADFDDVPGKSFVFKDNVQSVFRTSTDYDEPGRKRVLLIEYDIKKGGYGGWALALEGYDAGEYDRITFLVKGSEGGEIFEIGLRDKSGVEVKLPLSRFGDVGKVWSKISIPFSAFEGVHSDALDNFNFTAITASGKGLIYIDNIQFEGERKKLSAIGTGAKITVDSMESSNPTSIYFIYEGDDSALKLNASRIVKEGDYSLELEYTLSTSRSWGSWVMASWQSREVTLDWRGAESVKLWVRGDGSGNFFEFIITDSDGKKWVYRDKNVLQSTHWELVEMPIDAFVQESGYGRKERELNLSQVSSYSIGLRGTGGSNTTSGVKTSVGKIQVDLLYLVGEQINPVWAAPPAAAQTAKSRLLKVGEIDLNLFMLLESLYTPEERSTVNHFGKLIINGKVNKVSGQLELVSDGQLFGDAAAYNVSLTTIGGTVAEIRSSDVRLTNFQAFVNDLNPYISQVTMGTQFIDYGPDIFSPIWGFKGGTIEGNVSRFNYHAFILKHKFDSYTVGSRVKTQWLETRLTAMMVYYRETARLSDASAVNSGQVVKARSSDLRETQNDWTYLIDAEKPIFDDRVTVGGTYGFNRYHLNAVVDRSNIFFPVYSTDRDPPLRVNGDLVKGKIKFDDLWIPGMRLNSEYRKIGIEFKPRYRQSPFFYDEYRSDQEGYNVRLIESWKGFTASLEYDDMVLLSNKDYFRRRVNWGIAYYGFDKLDFGLNQELTREVYQTRSSRTDITGGKDEESVRTEVFFRVQSSPRMSIYVLPRREEVHSPSSRNRFSNESLYAKMDYYAMTNMKIVGEFKTFRFGNKDWEPNTYPFDDNFFRFKIELNF